MAKKEKVKKERKKGTFFKDFKDFAMRGNVLDMAVGVVVGGAFGKIISSLVADIIMPIVGLIIGGHNIAEAKVDLKKAVIDSNTQEILKPAVEFRYGSFMQTIIDFIIIAFCVFLFVRMIMKVKNAAEELKLKREAEEAAAQAEVSEDAEAEKVVEAEVEDVEKAVAVSTMSQKDAADIKALLKDIRDTLARGALPTDPKRDKQ